MTKAKFRSTSRSQQHIQISAAYAGSSTTQCQQLSTGTRIFSTRNSTPMEWNETTLQMVGGSLDGTRVWGRIDTCICMAKSLCCSPETITMLLVSSNSMPSELPGKPHWRQKEKRETEEVMVGWHHQCNGINLGKLQEMVGDREAWHGAVHGITKRRARLGYWTTTKPQYKIKSFLKKRVTRFQATQMFNCIAVIHLMVNYHISAARTWTLFDDRWRVYFFLYGQLGIQVVYF